MRRQWLVLDVAAILVFVVIGRAAHHHGESAAGVLSTAWPFAVGLVLGWLLVSLGRLSPGSWRGGAVIVPVVVAVAMVLRVVAGQGTAIPFILVALAFLGLFMLGPRVLAAAARRLR